tara:strand:+ start:29 stop:604 length:576 start_codon:yes stop_codon:yes gene_type:complete
MAINFSGFGTQTQPSGWQKIAESYSTTNVDNIDINNLFTAGQTVNYRGFRLVGSFVPVTDSGYLYAYWRYNGGNYSTNNYHWGKQGTYPNDNEYTQAASSQNHMRIINNGGNQTHEGQRVNLEFYPQNSSMSNYLGNFMTWTTIRLDAGNNFRTETGAGYFNDNTQMNGIRLQYNSGQISIHAYTLWGLTH